MQIFYNWVADVPFAFVDFKAQYSLQLDFLRPLSCELISEFGSAFMDAVNLWQAVPGKDTHL